MAIVKKSQLKPQLRTALAVLGRCRSVAGVYHKLVDLKITGFPKHGSCCPIAVYLRRATGCRFDVTYLSIENDDFLIPTPSIVSSFILNFDRYPQAFPEVLKHANHKKDSA